MSLFRFPAPAEYGDGRQPFPGSNMRGKLRQHMTPNAGPMGYRAPTNPHYSHPDRSVPEDDYEGQAASWPRQEIISGRRPERGYLLNADPEYSQQNPEHAYDAEYDSAGRRGYEAGYGLVDNRTSEGYPPPSREERVDTAMVLRQTTRNTPIQVGTENTTVLIELPVREDLRMTLDMEWRIQIDIRVQSREVMESQEDLNLTGLMELQPGICNGQRGVIHHLWILMRHQRIMVAKGEAVRMCAEDMVEGVQLILVSMDMAQWKKCARETRANGSMGPQWIRVGHREQSMDKLYQGLHTGAIQAGKTTEEQHLVLTQGLMVTEILLISMQIGKSRKMNSPMETEEARGTLLLDQRIC